VAGPCPACDVSYASSLGLGIASADGLSAFVAATASFRGSAGSPRLSPDGESGILSTPRHEGDGRLGAFGSACSRWRAKRGSCGAYRTSRQPHLS
jgi:hypothetical protein